MKLHTTKSLIATAILGALFLHSSDTFAVQPKLKQSDIRFLRQLMQIN